jgi:radical SAM enzyme (TIGR01210 family)
MEFMTEILKKTNYLPNRWDKPFVREGLDFMMIYFMSRLCSYKQRTGGCTFCTIENRALGNINYLDQFRYAIDQIKGKQKKNILLFNRNFLDDRELPEETRRELLEEAKKYATETISIESRPEYVTGERLKDIRNILGMDLEVDLSIGVETTNDFIRKYNHNKGFTMADVMTAKSVMDKYRISFVPFIFVKPLFVTERMAIEDTTKSIQKVLDMGAKRVSVQPMHAYRGSLGGVMVESGRMTPPNLWSIWQIMANLKDVSRVGVQAINPKKLHPLPDYMPKSSTDSFFRLEEILTGKAPVSSAPETKSRCEWRRELANELNVGPEDKLIEDLRYLKQRLDIKSEVPEEQIRIDYDKEYSW